MREVYNTCNRAGDAYPRNQFLDQGDEVADTTAQHTVDHGSDRGRYGAGAGLYKFAAPEPPPVSVEPNLSRQLIDGLLRQYLLD